MTRPEAIVEGHCPDADVLGLEPHEVDPVRIILAAQLRLRRCRLGCSATDGRAAQSEVHRIIAARDALLRQSVGSLACRGLGGGESACPAASRRTS